MPVRLVSVILLAAAGAPSAHAQVPPSPRSPTTQARLEAVVRQHADTVEGGGAAIQFLFQGVPMAAVSDTAADRMRIIAPVAEDGALTDALRRRVLEANFHSALDARYATSQGVLFAAFMHPLSSLTEDEIVSALHQVASLVRTFGSTYSSGPLIYGTPPPEPPR